MRARTVMLDLAALCLAAVGLSGCSGNSGDGRECYEVEEALMATIAEGANQNPITPVDAAAVKSESFEDAYVVAMSFTASGVEESETGTWAVATLESPYAPILAIDGFAQEFTDWPGEINGEQLDVTEDGVDEAKACLDE